MSTKKVITSSMIGNGLEWYDYALYGHFAAIISRKFFPATDPAVALIATFGIFAAGFLMRPIGAIFFGYIGDKYGRKNALALSILLMAIPTACIGLLPSYETIGIAAPILLTIIRLTQGIAIGGEFGGSIVYLVEHAPEKYKNLIGSTSMVSLILGILAGAAVSTLMAKCMSPESFDEWGWRVPFILGLFIGLVGLYIRTHLDESPAFMDAKETGHLSDKPVKDTFVFHYKELFIAMGAYMCVTIPFYLQTVFMNSFMVKYLNFNIADALSVNTTSLIVVLFVIPLSAYLCDKFKRATVMKFIILAYALFAFPFMMMLQTGELVYAYAAQIIFGIIIGFYLAPIPSVLVDIFPIRVRYTGMSLACNIGAAALGGTTPALITWLIMKTDNYYVISGHILLGCALSLWAVYAMQKRNVN
jgi:MHS family proline/betaine transporter-like MFS transporter